MSYILRIRMAHVIEAGRVMFLKPTTTELPAAEPEYNAHAKLESELRRIFEEDNAIALAALRQIADGAYANNDVAGDIARRALGDLGLLPATAAEADARRKEARERAKT